ncbi:MAG: GGDEF domain-containing protein [Burkholderiaceae bacterium]
MQTLSAGIALFLAEFCFGLILAGIHRFAPHDKCTRYWAIAMLLTGFGVLIVTENGGDPNHVKLLIGNFGIVFGGVCYWWGIRLFYRRSRSRGGWLIGFAFFLLFGTLLAAGATLFARSLLISCFTLLLIGLYLFELVRRQPQRPTFGRLLAITGVGVLLLTYLLRVLLLVKGLGGSLTHDSGMADVIVLFFIPMVALLLFGAGLMLMYFERIIADNLRLASEDALTGLPNRRAIAGAGEQALAHALRHREPLTVAILDVDYFKRINDSFGHDAGDQVLADIATLLRTECRQQDLVGRYGGEEFCIVFPHTGQAAAAAAAERILGAARRYRFRQDGGLTFSIGMAVLEHDWSATVSWAALLKTADQQLYLAKEAGRDQCRLVPFALASGANAPLPARDE